jgi:hypothetical protein
MTDQPETKGDDDKNTMPDQPVAKGSDEKSSADQPLSKGDDDKSTEDSSSIKQVDASSSQPDVEDGDASQTTPKSAASIERSLRMNNSDEDILEEMIRKEALHQVAAAWEAQRRLMNAYAAKVDEEKSHSRKHD